MKLLSIISTLLLATILFNGCKENPTNASVTPVDSTFCWIQTKDLNNRSVFSMVSISGKLYAGTDSGIFLTTNNGTSWTHITSGLLNYYVISLISFTSDSGVTYLFAGTQVSGVHLSTDNGVSWTQVNSGLTNSFVTSFAVTPNQKFLFAGTWGGVFRSTNKGSSWTAVNSGLMSINVECLSTYGSNLFVGTMDGIYLSVNNGTSWSHLNLGQSGHEDVLSLAYITRTTGQTYLFAGTQFVGVHLSKDNGTSWTPVDSSLKAYYVPALTVKDSIIFAAGSGVFASTNLGASWIALKLGLTITDIRSLATNETYLFAGAFAGGVFKRKL